MGREMELYEKTVGRGSVWAMWILGGLLLQGDEVSPKVPSCSALQSLSDMGHEDEDVSGESLCWHFLIYVIFISVCVSAYPPKN